MSLAKRFDEVHGRGAFSTLMLVGGLLAGLLMLFPLIKITDRLIDIHLPVPECAKGSDD